MVVAVGVTVEFNALLSTNLFDWNVSSTVLVTTFNGVVLGVKLLVYTAALVMRKLLTYPGKS